MTLTSTLGWTHCADRADHARGYTCGLWLLFHTLVARAHLVTVEGRPGLAAENAEGEGDALAAAALRAVYGFVTHFLGCAHCREHFLSAHPPAEVE